MPVVNITVTPQGLVVRPLKVVINRDDQTITWQIQGGTWAENGIVFNPARPGQTEEWPGGPAQLVDGKYVADAADPLPHGSPVQRYTYTINYFDSSGTRRKQGPGRALVADAVTDAVADIVSDADPQQPLSDDPGIENQPVP